MVAAGKRADLAHVAGYDVRNFLIVFVGSLAGLEVYVRVLGGTAGYRLVGVEGPGAEPCESLLAYERTEVLRVENFDLLDFVRCAEAVEEMHERHA